MSALLPLPTLDATPRPIGLDPPVWPDVGLGSDGVFRLKTPAIFLPLLVQGPKYKGARGGRGSGKSHFFAECLIEECLLDPYTRAVCIREVQRSLKQSSKKLVEDKIRELRVGSYFEILEYEIHVLDDNGKRCGIIIFEGMQNHTADSIKSFEGFRIAWVEEAQSLSQRSLNLLYPTIRMKGAQIWFSWNPEKPSDPIEQFLCGDDAATDPDIKVITANYHDNPYFYSTELVGDMERDKRRDSDKYAHIWLGAYAKRSEAIVFKNWRIAIFETPAVVERFYFGADWGFSVDPSVLVRCWAGRVEHRGKDALGNDLFLAIPDPRGTCLFLDREAYKVGCQIEETPALFAGDCPSKMLGHNGGPRWENPHHHRGIEGALKWPITADSARPETIDYMSRAGFRIKAALKGPGSIEDGIEFLKNYDIYVLPTCVHMIDELSLYSYKVDPKTDEVLPILEDKKNHCLVAGTQVRTQRGELGIEDVRVGDLVEGSLGYRRVTFSDVTGIDRDTVIVTTTLGEFRCTPDHEVYTQRGFVRADALRSVDTVFGPIAGIASTGHSSSIDTARQELARGRVLTVSPGGIADRVYDLTVDETHDFFANDVLVSNCIDALRYSVEGARRGGLKISDAALAKV